ncbi:MAG: sensor histidine kinase [Blautia sp.]|jgi:two-component system sensor histidine kinase SenX3
MKFHTQRQTFRRLNEMLDAALTGTFVEGDYDESELSKLEAKWKRYLNDSSRSRQEVEKEREVLKGLVSDISHQTKTPLANIRLYGELLAEKKLDPDSRALVERLSAQTERLEFLIQSLVKMSRLEAGTLQVSPKIGKLRPMLDAVALQAREKAAAKGITLLVEADPELQAYFDEKWTGEAIYNVVDNGIKYSPPDTILRIFVHEYEMYTRIGIQDQGMGIREEEMGQIYTRFYRSPRVQGEEGVGIGLYLTREILQRSGGFIKAAAAKGGGSIFYIYLPRESWMQ